MLLSFKLQPEKYHPLALFQQCNKSLPKPTYNFSFPIFRSLQLCLSITLYSSWDHKLQGLWDFSRGQQFKGNIFFIRGFTVLFTLELTLELHRHTI